MHPTQPARSPLVRKVATRLAWLLLVALGDMALGELGLGDQGFGGSRALAQLSTAQEAAAFMAVSPYLNLQGNVFGNQPQFQTQVQPFSNTQRNIGVQDAQLQSLSRGVGRPAAAGSTARARNSMFGSRNASALTTGHATRFMTYSHYYPAPRR